MALARFGASEVSTAPLRHDASASRSTSTQRTHWKAQKRTGDALPKRVEKVIETGNALATEAKELGRAR